MTRKSMITGYNGVLEALVVVSTATLLLSGCADVGGGASVEPDVTFLPADLTGDSGASDTANAPSGASTKAASDSGPGTFSGRVVMTGAAPTLKPLFVKDAEIKDKEVCAADDVPDERLVLGADNGVKNVFIYMKKAPKGSPAMEPPTTDLFFDQKNCQFEPHCMIVPVGQPLKVLSDDAIAHNTHTNPAKNNGVSSVVPPNDRVGVLQLTYTRSEDPFSVTCDFHAWMKAYHLPLDHPYGAVTDKDGNFEIKNVPGGKHDFVVWHEAANGGYVERKLTIEMSAAGVVEQITFPADKLNL